MTARLERQALFYPFHLCHEQTLSRLLTEYANVHFMDYMAVQLTEMSGMTAFPDRMGDSHPDLVASGRIIQGHPVSGPLNAMMIADINRDLADPEWRAAFHRALCDNRRFQRGLFDLSHGLVLGGAIVPGPAAFLRLTEDNRQFQPVSVEDLKTMSRARPRGEDAYSYEYAYALLKTAAALRYTIGLCETHTIEAVTDSETHHRLLEVTVDREKLAIRQRYMSREGY